MAEIGSLPSEFAFRSLTVSGRTTSDVPGGPSSDHGAYGWVTGWYRCGSPFVVFRSLRKERSGIHHWDRRGVFSMGCQNPSKCWVLIFNQMGKEVILCLVHEFLLKFLVPKYLLGSYNYVSCETFEQLQPYYISGWWFGTFFFPYIGNNHPNWLIFFRGVETTNQICLMVQTSLNMLAWKFLGWLATFRSSYVNWAQKTRVKTMHERPAFSLSFKKCVSPCDYSTISWRTPLPPWTLNVEGKTFKSPKTTMFWEDYPQWLSYVRRATQHERCGRSTSWTQRDAM